MGSCCFTPRKYNFLWWYWLLLASIVGIPMLLAAWYMQRQKRKIEAADGANLPTEDIEDRLHRAGKKAARSFWIETYMFCCLGYIGALFLIESLPSLSNFEKTQAYCTAYLLIWEFLLCLLIANSVIVLTRKRTSFGAQAIITVAALGFWIIVNPWGRMLCLFDIADASLSMAAGERRLDLIFPSTDFIRPLISTLTFACCWFAMHYWRNFIDQPTRRNIWRSIGALAVAAFLYCGIERYGNVVHYYVHEIARLKAPDSATAREFETNIIPPPRYRDELEYRKNVP